MDENLGEYIALLRTMEQWLNTQLWNIVLN
jgi:hypothetical protein